MSAKISIRFFEDREVRALWDEEKAKWWFSVLDIVAVLNDQDDYNKNRNYWKYLKAKLKKENSISEQTRNHQHTRLRHYFPTFAKIPHFHDVTHRPHPNRHP